MKTRKFFLSDMTDSDFLLSSLGDLPQGGFKPQCRDRLPEKHAHRKSKFNRELKGSSAVK